MMANELPKRKPTRLKYYNYSSVGSYFITICVKDRKRLLCRIGVGFGIYDEPQINLSKYGVIAERYIKKMADDYDDISIDNYVIMPNHIHMLLSIHNSNGASQVPHPTNERIPKFVSLFKRYCNRQIGYNIWQKSFNDHIIRDEQDYLRRWRYIDNNPIKWELDKYY